MPRAFIVYSSINHVSYIEDILKVVDSVLKSLDITPFLLRNQIKAGELYSLAIQAMVTESDLGIVILDGLRPNVAFEYGLLSMKNIEIIPLKKFDAKVSVKSLYYNSCLLYTSSSPRDRS